MGKLYIGIDNGTSGCITILDDKGKLLYFQPVPSFQLESFKKPEIVTKTVEKKDRKTKQITKVKKKIVKQSHYSIIDIDELQKILAKFTATTYNGDVHVWLERPVVNAFNMWALSTVLSSFAAWVCVMLVLRKLQLSYKTVDSKEWQEIMVPQAMAKNNPALKGLKKGDRNKALKVAADELGAKLYPELAGQKDLDSVCMVRHYYNLERGKSNV